MEKLKPYFPILTWGPNYQKEYLIRDFIAGFTVALTVVPQVSGNICIFGKPRKF